MTVPKRSRLRRILKRAGTGLCVLIVIAWIFSLRWSVRFTPTGKSPDLMIELWDGFVSVVMVVGPPQSIAVKEDVACLVLQDVGNVPHLRRFYGFIAPGSYLVPGNSGVRVTHIPIWLCLFLVFATTALLYRRRCIPPGHCEKCGYDLTGNVSGICSECGEPCEAEASAT